ncbi:daunorubicin ABC transporter ATP-binding protein [Halorientalis sp. IM1011]|uniref:ABC transporter ATP-binding protein n=1 Tax=Halorientalis sp. IM1011 TaxID=1932360 RepID=UPI00097CC6EC|nr:ABC transporter ATP-binding protein [Halorientalis sp. IM1011]AQL43152.1 daunorubicin ABC transporter ATP-binding protein [Halorientalis sp. IM1011]
MQSTRPATETDRADPPTGDLAIEAENVHVTYADGTEAVRGVDLAVGAGEFFGFLGPNGAGKTTTIKTLVTLLHPTRGSVRINGYDTTEEPQAVRESIGYMAQETSVDEELTARENVRYTCEVYGVPKAERDERIADLLELVGLDEVADERAETFSGGMQKRLDAATVLVHRPPVVFLDEPTTGLDPEARLQFWEYLQSINDRGTSVFLTTQYLEEVDRLCDRLALLRDGVVVTTDTPAALKSAVGGDVFDVTLVDAADRDRATRAVYRSGVFEDPTVEPTDDGLTITAENARDGIGGLFRALDSVGVAVTGFDVRSPTLDDVFLRLTDEDLESVEDSATRELEVAR